MVTILMASTLLCIGGAATAQSVLEPLARGVVASTSAPKHAAGTRQQPVITPSPSPTVSASPSPTASASESPSPSTTPGVSHSLPASQVAPQVGAVFGSSGLGGSHFCTASVVDSARGDLILSAAHCMDSTSDVFVPAYHDGIAPYGVWHLERIVVDQQWSADSDPDHDVAFGIVAPADGRTIQSVVGGDELGIDQGTTNPVTVVGYPQTSQEPLTCTNRVSSFSSTQLEIGCTGFTGGTSGSPWVTGGIPGTVIGVIGGYETGGDTPDISYSVAFGPSVENLYQEAASDRTD